MKRVLMRVGLGLVLVLAGIVVSLCVAGASYAPTLAVPPGFAGKYVDVAGVSLRVLQEGAGRDLLLIHGSPGSLEDYALQAKELASSFRVTRYDRPGHGFSATGEGYSFAYNAQIALALIEKLKLERVIVVGHSYGGSTSLALALLRSPRVTAHVVIDSAAYKPVRPVNPLYKYTSLPVLGLGLLRAIPREAVRKKVAQALHDEFLAGPPPKGFVELRSNMWTEPKIGHTLAKEHLHSAEELRTLSPHYPEIKAPVYFIAQNDSAPRREGAEHFKRDVPQTVLVLQPNSGHYIQFEQPAAVTQLILRAAAEH
jgi:pimeloyl-ACP methyl ester carboxylesterase